MKIRFKTQCQALSKTDLLVLIGLESKKIQPPTSVALLPEPLKAFKAGHLEARLTDARSGPANRVLLVGLGSRKQANAEAVRRAAAIAVKKAEKIGAASLTFWIDASID